MAWNRRFPATDKKYRGHIVHHTCPTPSLRSNGPARPGHRRPDGRSARVGRPVTGPDPTGPDGAPPAGGQAGCAGRGEPTRRAAARERLGLAAIIRRFRSVRREVYFALTAPPVLVAHNAGMSTRSSR